MSARYRLLAFDWDGTLMDSVARIVASIHAAIEIVGSEPRSPDQIRDIIGLGLAEAVRRLYPAQAEELRERLAAAYRHHFLEECATPSRLFPGVVEVLAGLQRQGYLLTVATGKGVRGLDKDLRETGTAHLFQATRTAEQTRSKPHPQMLLELAASLSVPIEQVLMIGDTEYDMQMARAAGAGAIAASYGVHPRERLLRHDPLAVIDAIDQLPARLRGLEAGGTIAARRNFEDGVE